MRRTVILLGVLSAVLAGCGTGDDASPQQNSTSASPGEAGPFFGQCGSVNDDEVLSTFAVPAFTMITRNSVGCEWEVAGSTGPSVSFSWYRGSPIDRERSGSELIGRPADDIEIDGNPGFSAATDNYLCEVGVQFGKDFMHWSVTYGDQPPSSDPCDVATRLATLTVERAQ
ncbi:DUF3558 domain-containing protein [Rhodococcoides fascians]|uniref:DUF3558 domain-containing protein n=1 Tax=Rhodococcoides fascians TaxID=1828 RepID=UPI000370DBBF|nr:MULTISPECIES: DUF3558 domain-containing protein [Rhodococcus]OZC57341.1 DUF3558 domain-containing protein [Rhodococcus sp. 06-621-2]OZD58784.1 DUF3558 domain-containing protein [Rhodococcus sp. 06-1059B-a]OZE80729.1 DUF3558 domain-containing protein [Rhodococcus sp. 15-649-1-2]